MRRARSLRSTLAVVIISLALCAAALAAHPHNGARYSGFTAEKANGYAAPISFSVSHSGRQLLQFTYSTIGCFSGQIVFQPGADPFAKPIYVVNVGKITVSDAGSFSIRKAKYSHTNSALGVKIATTTTVKGHFVNASSATGKITLTQKITGGLGNHACGPTSYSFNAKTS